MPPDMDWSQRADATELMDGPCSYEEFRDCLHDLAQVNLVTLAYRPTLTWLGRMAKTLPAGHVLRIVDVGCGYGDMLRKIAGWAAKRGIAVELTGIDLNPYSARSAAEVPVPGRQSIAWVTEDAFRYRAPGGIDVILCSLFTHHLKHREVAVFLGWMEATARRGWFVNDLRRSRFSWHGFRLLAKLAGWHRFVQNDGPVSITRSFVAGDWCRLCREAGLLPQAVEIRRWFPGRLCVARMK